jgi:GntR family transcriptional regulator
VNLKIDRHSPTPVYQQMIDAIVVAIEANQLGIGEKLPSIREMSAQLGINQNTTVRVYRELEIRGYIESKAGSGSFVRPMNEKAAAAAKQARMNDFFRLMLGEAKAHRIDEHDLLQFLRARAGT